MNNTFTLPNGYKESFKIDLKENKKLYIGINASATIVMLALLLPVLFTKLDIILSDNTYGSSLFTLFLLLFSLAYIVLHELVHGIFIRIFSGKWGNFGFKGAYAFAGSECYFNKASYLIIALAPIVIWGIVLALLNIFMPMNYLWLALYFVQTMNISGSVGDIYVTARLLKESPDILIKDTGVDMTIFNR